MSLCFSLMYESEADEKRLDFIAGTPAMVSIGIGKIVLFFDPRFVFKGQCMNCPFPTLYGG